MAVETYQLVIRKGPKAGQVYPLLAHTITVGRDPMADIVITDPEVSRQHIRLTQVGNEYEIQDLGSTNGTFINGRRLGSEPVRLTSGQEIILGNGVTLLYQSSSQDDEPEVDEAVVFPRTDVQASPVAVYDVPAASPSIGQPDIGERPIAAQPEAQPRPRMTRAATPDPKSGDKSRRNPPPDSGREGQRRNIATIIVVTLLLLCCCCGFILFMYYYGGDWLLRQMGYITLLQPFTF